MDVRVEFRRLSAEELMLLNCGVEDSWESLDCKEIKSVHPKGDQSWISIGRTDAEAEAPIFWLPDAKNWLIGKDPDAGKDWGQEEKGVTEHDMVGWHHWLRGHEFEQSLGVDDGQGSLACCSPWSCRVRQHWVTEVNWTWANSRRQWKTREPAVLQPMGSQRVSHDWVTELNWNTERHLECVYILEIDGVTK